MQDVATQCVSFHSDFAELPVAVCTIVERARGWPSIGCVRVDEDRGLHCKIVD